MAECVRTTQPPHLHSPVRFQMIQEPEEKWEPLKPTDRVFDVGPQDGRVTIEASGRGGLFGARVRVREGQWMKQTTPLQILVPVQIARMTKEERFTLAKDLPKV